MMFKNICDRFGFTVLKALFLTLRLFIRGNGYICVDNLYEVHASCIDTYTIFQYLQQTKRNSKYLIWRENLAYKDVSKVRNVIVLNRQGTPNASNFYFMRKTFWSLLTCKYFVSSFYGSVPTEYRNFLLNLKGLYLVGVGHGPVFLKTLVFNFPFCQDKEWNLYLVSSESEKQLFIQNGWREAKLIKGSLPRFDCCVNQFIEKQPRKIFIMFTWRQTFEENRNLFYGSKYLKEMYSLLSTLKRKTKDQNIKIVLGLHHALLDICNIGRIPFPVELADTNNLIHEINTSSLFITDYSSIFWDSAYLEHPIIFYRLDDGDKFLNSIDRKDQTNAKDKDNQLYNVFYNEDAVVNKVLQYIANDFVLEDDYRKLMKSYFYTKQKNTENFIKQLELHK